MARTRHIARAAIRDDSDGDDLTRLAGSVRTVIILQGAM
jgi:hypothetical protein